MSRIQRATSFLLYVKDSTIAVLPFVNVGSEAGNDYFSDGITEEIINALARIRNLRVISRRSSFYFKNKDIPLKEIARQLNVATILEGSVRTSAEQVRITAQLIQAEDDVHYWSESWDRKLENIFDVQDEISLLIADKLREQMGHFVIGEHLVTPGTQSLDAYHHALRARYHFNKWNPDDIRIAIDYYNRSITIDPNLAESYVGLADAYGFMATTEFMPREEAWGKAAECTHTAFELQPENAGVHYQLANLAFFVECDFGGAVRHTRRSIELMPSYPEGLQYMSFLSVLRGDMAEGRNYLEAALAVDPFNQETLFYKAFYYYRTGEYRPALDQLDDCLRTNPKNIPVLIVKTYVLLKLARYDEVLSLLDSLPESIVMPSEDLGLRCMAAVMKGDAESAAPLLRQLEEAAGSPTALQAHSYLFLAYANLGEHDRAFDWLDRSIATNSSILLLSFSDPLAEPLKADSRYRTFHERIYTPIEPETPATLSRNELLDAATAREYARKLQSAMESESAYLNPELTLRSLAAQIEIHPNQLSWLLNEHIGKNFSSYVNDFRVEHFKRLATDPSNSHISLIGLAFESGFNSKTVFNTYFKKVEGVTPGAFLKSLA